MVCYVGNDTALIAEGKAEWIVVVAQMLGVPDPALLVMLDRTEPSVPRDKLRQRFGCRRLRKASSGRLVAGGDVPVIKPPPPAWPESRTS
ncbi:hypothetical protein ABZ540_33695 [Nocardia xishanensis]|uniref:hypothetical protein n=1 Tax=Nocardia xishanensis TaxID=238964 RepID=UPI0033DB7954